MSRSSAPEPPLIAASLQIAGKRQRILACVLCQGRKIKCDRRFPCSNCKRAQTQCVPAAPQTPRQRRRRFPERDLLDRLRRYEDLLRQNKIKFEPLHPEASPIKVESHGLQDESHEYESRGRAESVVAAGAGQSFSSTKSGAETELGYEAKSIWHAINQGPHTRQSIDSVSESSSDDLVLEATIKDAWEELFESGENTIFASREEALDVSTLHPEQVQIFRHWQTYIDNVNPLLRVTHVATLQGRVIEAVGDLRSVKPSLAALMFGIYCMSILSMDNDECRAIFGVSKGPLLAKYQFGCQQALCDCGFLRSTDRDCLTALYLYLISIRPRTDPCSLCSMLGVAIRTAQRMGLHSEAANSRCPAFEGEMRRRLWWSLVMFDTRVCEMADYRTAILTPSWDCRTPLNLNDFELRPEMKRLPAAQGKSTEMLFAVVRSEIGDFVRHSNFHLDFTSPALKAMAKDINTQADNELSRLEAMLEKKYLSFCDAADPIQFMTIWTSRGQLARSCLFEHYSKHSVPSTQLTDTQRDAAIVHALNMLECDTKIFTSTSSKGYLWFTELYFPFVAYIHVTQDLKKRPMSQHAERAWQTMGDNRIARLAHEARCGPAREEHKPIRDIFNRLILQCWVPREEALRRSGKLLKEPQIVSDIKRKTLPRVQDSSSQNFDLDSIDNILSANFDWPSSLPLDPDARMLFRGSRHYDAFENAMSANQSTDNLAGMNNPGSNGPSWPAMDWNPLYNHDW